MDTSSDEMAPVWSALRTAILSVGGACAGYGLFSQNAVVLIASLAPTAAAALWSVWAAVQKVRQKKVAEAVGVQAGINLVTSGQALTIAGALLTVANPDMTPPRPVTLQSAAEIVKNFAPIAAPKAV